VQVSGTAVLDTTDLEQCTREQASQCVFVEKIENHTMAASNEEDGEAPVSESPPPMISEELSGDGAVILVHTGWQ
jgi:hypothetical protein